jgi:hypothetical protein
MTQWKNYPRTYTIDTVVTMLAEWDLLYGKYWLSVSLPEESHHWFPAFWG